MEWTGTTNPPIEPSQQEQQEEGVAPMQQEVIVVQDDNIALQGDAQPQPKQQQPETIVIADEVTPTEANVALYSRIPPLSDELTLKNLCLKVVAKSLRSREQFETVALVATSIASAIRSLLPISEQIKLLNEVRVWYPAYPSETAAASSTETCGLYYVHTYNDLGQLHGQATEWWPNGTVSCIKHYVNGELEGPAIWYNSAGQVRMEFNYKNGKRDGEQKEWYRNGTRLSHYYCANDKRHGKYKAWFKSGVLEFRYVYDMGKLHGVQREYHRTSKVWLENHFDHGKREGPWLTWYENGATSLVSEFKDDKLHGVREKFDKQGRPTFHEEYDMGQKHGIWKEWGSYQQLTTHKRWEHDVCVQNMLHTYMHY